MSAAGDTTAIMNLIAKYAELVDDGDFGGVGALFSGGVFRGGGGVVGGEEVEGMLRGMVIVYEDGTPRTHHVTTNVAVEMEGDEAAARSYFTVFQALPESPLQAIVTGRYRDRFGRVEGEWRFLEREVDIRMTGDLSGHLRRKPAAD
ncbi:nuclear transport factor 2 family protein [Nocardia yamanashiensis]|uniref:nuclear transport factor 2 family protein n=1 Tax=Nocardia yamanashiensis TaxID=209247 RepID=UPI00082FCBFA|nr:nuclear transport factor 2 family protein [Nocardia yamanashiensis]